MFNYTAFPEIHSGDEHFGIEGYVRPRAVSPRETTAGKTLFVFPFREEAEPEHPDRALAAAAAAEIRTGLRHLGPTTLLFLKNLDEIAWMVDDGGQCTYLREVKPENGCQRISVIGANSSGDQAEDWLVFSREVAYQGESLRDIQVAYRLEGSKAKGDERIVNQGVYPLAVFFPTERKTNLHLLIQGPYNTTPARDNVRDDDLNNWLVKQTAQLVVDSLEVIKAVGLLTVDFLPVLPIREWSHDEMFRPIRDAVEKAFRQYELLPTHSGNYARATDVRMARGGELRQLVSSEQLQALYASPTPVYWLPEQITADRMAELHGYLRNLGIGEVDPGAFVNLLSLEFLQQQSDDWLIEFYSYLDGIESLWQQRYPVGAARRKPIIRLEDGKHVTPFDHTGKLQAFLPMATESYFPTVKRSITSAPQALEFLRHLGLTKPDIVDAAIDAIDVSLPRFLNRGNMSNASTALLVF